LDFQHHPFWRGEGLRFDLGLKARRIGDGTRSRTRIARINRIRATDNEKRINPMSAAVSEKIDLLARELYEGDPQPTYAWLRENAPVYWDEINEIWGISRHADITSISRDPKRFSSANGSRPNTQGSGSMIDNDDPKHVAFRKIFQKEITPRGAKQFIPRIERIVDDIFAGLKGKSEFDLVKELAIPLPVRVIIEALGLDDADWARYAEIAETTMAAGGGPRYQSDAMIEMAGAYYGEAMGVAAQRRKAGEANGFGSDWFSKIVERAGEGITKREDVEIASESLLLLNGGSDTTRHVIAGGCLALMEHPEQFALLKSEPERLPDAIEEMIRWVSPLLNMSRTATEDVELHGKTIKAGQQVLLMYAAANRDESVFKDPGNFDISRHPNPHVSFGIGTHFCMGANIARLELRCVFEAVIKHLPKMERATEGPLSMNAPAFASGLRTLPIRVNAA
jgi:cytochrome P450 family 142 subfamily A polypeptide 1